MSKTKARARRLPPDVTGVSGSAVSATGMAIRLGLTDTSPVGATELYPLFDLIPGETRPARGEMCEGLPIFAWASEQLAAKCVGVADRTVRDWASRRGLPHRKTSTARQYPIPHLTIWAIEYRIASKRENRDELSFTMALARNRLRRAEDDERAAGLS